MPPKGAAKAAPKEIDESQLTPGAIVLYRLRGYPPWPSLVWAPVPASLRASRVDCGRAGLGGWLTVGRDGGTYPCGGEESETDERTRVSSSFFPN